MEEEEDEVEKSRKKRDGPDGRRGGIEEKQRIR